jgi:F0F1-type ATP synthase assembly protein I
MKQTTAPRQTPSPNGGETKPIAKPSRSENPRSEFFIAAANMSWQLAIVVLVPIVGGFKLDQKLDTSPWLVIIGFVVAMAGTGLVIWQTLQAANRIAAQGSGK